MKYGREKLCEPLEMRAGVEEARLKAVVCYRAENNTGAMVLKWRERCSTVIRLPASLVGVVSGFTKKACWSWVLK